MTEKLPRRGRARREVIEIASQSAGAVLLFAGLFVWLPIGLAMILAGVTLLAFGTAYEMTGGDVRGTREDASDQHSDGTAY